MQIRNKSDSAREITVDGDVLVIEPGEAVEVPDDLANGIKPSGKEGDPEYRAGVSGLLAQTDVWDKAPRRPKSDAEEG